MIRSSLILATVALLAQGCSTMPSTGASTPSQMGNLILAEPAPVSPRSQMALARLDQILAQMPDIPSSQKAELFYQRGVLYDSVGLSGLAGFDFNHAIKLKPDMAKAYNFLGIQYTQNMDFMQAYEAFDSTLEIEPEHEYAYLNRGIALYYGGRAELAARDLEQFYRHDESDPYRALWRYIAEVEVDPETALVHLAEARPKLSDRQWANVLVDFYLGKVTENQVLSILKSGVTNQRQLTDRLCEAYFYLGKHHSFLGKRGYASNYFKLALSTNVYEFVEHRYARLELSMLRESTSSKGNTQ